ncbi:Multidrug resistance-associated protein 4 [Oopsacas minuta]|uniref:Multidrug resistance-associated protein 4 n=1 Tax=Oopsacas minuta TaxID=111878 RepID=A0AAV7JMZ8_9METZ|nr:Multidrug resistance-associated protein 4 [Oopsacas minuta]
MRGVLRDKLVLMVTHQINYVRQCDYVIVMKNGSVVSSGTYNKIVAENEFCREFLQRLEKKEDDTEKETEPIESVNNTETNKILKTLESSKEEDPTIVEPLSSAMTAEDYRPNSISFITYLRYFWAGGIIATLFMLILTVLSNAGLVLAYYWMQSIDNCTLTLTTNMSIGMYNITCLPWYFDYNNPGAIRLLALFTFSGSLFVLVRGFSFYYVVLQAGRRLHNRMLHRLVHTPMHFFDTNPSGRILNRFSKDIGFMDEQLPMSFYDFGNTLRLMLLL